MQKAILLFAFLILLGSCTKKETFQVRQDNSNEIEELAAFSNYLELPPNPFNYSIKMPVYLKAVGMEDKTISDVKATLGRVLFYDKNLSKDRQIACSSCHKQEKAFSDDVAFSKGTEGRFTLRNSLALGNSASFASHYSKINGSSPFLFWDDRAETVAQQSAQTLANPREMGLSMEEVIARIKEQPYYPYIWKQIYGNFDVTGNQVLECLQEFVGSIGGTNSLFDHALEITGGQLSATDTIVHTVYYGNGDTTILTGLPGFSQDQFRGLKIFVDNCSKCHSPIRPFQEVFEACNGLDLNYLDLGVGAISLEQKDNGVFKSPPLRNIALTAPYMHDGRFKTLEEVINFYSENVQNHANLSPVMVKNGSVNKHFTPTQKAQLLAFLGTLTDYSLIQETRFSNPFK
jgi:cytochrome c peroxidase